MERSRFILDPEWNSMINLSAKHLYNMLVEKNEEFFVGPSTPLAVDGTNQSYNLPSDFYKLKAIDYTLNGVKTQMKRWVWAEREFLKDNCWELRYRIIGNTLKFYPVPSAQSFDVYYIPVLATLALDTDTMDGVCGFEEWVIWDVAIKALMKEESDVKDQLMERAKIESEIEDWAKVRDEAQPDRVQDVQGGLSIYGPFRGVGGWGAF